MYRRTGLKVRPEMSDRKYSRFLFISLSYLSYSKAAGATNWRFRTHQSYPPWIEREIMMTSRWWENDRVVIEQWVFFLVILSSFGCHFGAVVMFCRAWIYPCERARDRVEIISIPARFCRGIACRGTIERFSNISQKERCKINNVRRQIEK